MRAAKPTFHEPCSVPGCDHEELRVYDASTAEEQAPKKPIKPGTNEATVYEAMILAKKRHGEAIAFAATDWAQDSELSTKETSRALNSLRAGGHVVSEGPGRVKMWRLAP